MRASLLILGASLPLIACGPPAKLSQVESDVFKKSCAFTSCHTGSSPAGGLNLEGKTYARLVGMKAASGEVLVVPGKPDDSYLMKRLLGTKPNPVMPPDAPLDAARLEAVRGWISAGAKDD